MDVSLPCSRRSTCRRAARRWFHTHVGVQQHIGVYCMYLACPVSVVLIPFLSLGRFQSGACNQCRCDELVLPGSGRLDRCGG